MACAITDASLAVRSQTSSSIKDRPIIHVAACLNGVIYLTDVNGGRILRLDGKQAKTLATGLRNPGELAAGPDGSIYIAEFGPGAVRRILPLPERPVLYRAQVAPSLPSCHA